MKILRDQVQETEVHRFTCEASAIGLPALVSQWPENIETELGNGRSLYRYSIDWSPDDTIAAVRYRQELGCITVTIFND